MTRYYLIATLIVVVIGSIVFAHRLAQPDLKISAQPTGTPTVESPHAEPSGAAAPAFSAQGSWVLSALPACFDEQTRTRGPAADVSAKLPPPADRIAPGATIAAGDCSVLVRPTDLWITRGTDRLRVPPKAALYRVAGLLILVSETGGITEIRAYRPTQVGGR